MSGKRCVQISENLYGFSKPIMQFSRLAGVFPFVVEKRKGSLFLKWSTWYALYGYVIAVFFILMSYHGLFTDLIDSGDVSIYSMYETDKFVMFLLCTAYTLVVLCGVFYTPRKYLQFFDFLRYIEQIDFVISTTYNQADKHKSVLMMHFLMVYNFMAGAIDYYYCYTIMGETMSLFRIFIIQGGLIFLTGITLTMDFMYRHMVHSLTKRITKLNQLLDEQRIKVKPKDPACQNHHQGLVDELIGLRLTYLELMDAADIVNYLFGPNIVAAILSIIFLLVVHVYLSILSLSGERRGLAEFMDIFSFLILQVFRILLFTEPSYECLHQIDKIRLVLCKLFALDLSPDYKKEVRIFTLALRLRPLEFSACGFFEIDRLMFASLVGTVTTYVVILLQNQEKEGHG